MKKRKMLKIKRTVLKASVWAAVIVYLISICLLDSISWAPAIACAVALAWLVIMAWANGLFEGGEK